MKLYCSSFLVILLVAAAVFSCCAAADSKEDDSGKQNQALSKPNDRVVNETVDHVKTGVTVNLGISDSNGKSDGGDQKENRKSDSDSTNKSKEGSETREECDSSSNRCTDDDKTLVACLRVPGNESPALSLLIQNLGKAPLSITISAPDLVQLEKKQIELQENKHTEIKVSIKGVESGHLITLSAGHGNCTLNFRDQFVGIKKASDPHSSSQFNNIFKLKLSKGFMFVAALLLLVIFALTSAKFGKKYFARKDPKYQKLDMELPVSHSSKHDSGESEGWDNSWGENWDDEETPITPSLPVTPSLSSQGMASRKFSSKDGWKH